MNNELLLIINELLRRPYTINRVLAYQATRSIFRAVATYCKTLLELTQTSSIGEDIG